MPGLATALDLIWAAALILFALGIRRSGSVVARRPLGVVALIVAAVIPFASDIVWQVVALAATDRALSVAIGQSLTALSLAALLTATVVIGRADAVPRRVRWVPSIVLGAVAGAQVLAQVAAMAAPLAGQQLLVAVFMGSSFVGTLGILVLGLLAILFAPREPARETAESTVQVFPPA